MKVVIYRKYRKENYTIGRVYIDGKFFCNSLEPTDRGLFQYQSVSEILNAKIKGKTAIPCGKYKISRTYSNRFKRLMPQIMNVKGFSGVRIHAGNTAEDTEGCPLFGNNTQVGKVVNSRKMITEFETALQIAGGIASLEITHKYEE